MRTRTAAVSAAAAMGACAIALTACASQPAVTEVWRVDAPVMRPPVEIDGVLIAPVSDGDDEYSMQAWDGETGEQLWAQEATTWADGSLSPAWALSTEGNEVAMFMVPGEHGMTWRMVDPRSGDEIAWQAAGDDLETSWEEIRNIGACEPTSEPRALCFSVPDGEYSQFLRLGPEVALGEIPLVERDAGLYSLNLGLYQDDGTAEISLQSGGQRVWTQPFSALFDREPSGDELVDVLSGDEDIILLDSNGTYSDDDDAWDEAAIRTVAIDPASGETSWSRDGVRLLQVNLRRGVATGLDYRSGAYAPDADGDDSNEAVDVDYDIVRVDLTTGENLWSVPWSQALFDESNRHDTYSMTSPRGLLLQSDDGPVVIDIDSGAATPVPDGVALPCVSLDPLERAWNRGGEDATLVRFGERTWCSPEHEPIAEPVLDPMIVSLFGIETGEGVNVLLEATGLVAYRTSE